MSINEEIDKKQIRNLVEIKGIGDKLTEKILNSVGGEKNLFNIVENLELEKLTDIDGISQRKAIEIMNKLLGNPSTNFLKSERAIQLYEEIIDKILDYTNTKYSENRIKLLSPLNDKNKIIDRINFVMESKNKVSKLPIIKLRGLMKNLSDPVLVKPKYDASKAILTESPEDNDYLIDLGLNQYFPILNLSNSSSIEDELQEYELIFYVYSQGFLDVSDDDNMVLISKDSPAHEIVPDIILDYFNQNLELFEKVLETRKILNQDSVLEDIPGILAELNSYKLKDVDLDSVLSKAKKDADEKLKIAIKNVDIEGDEVLELLNNNFPPKIDKIFDDILTPSKKEIKEITGIDFDPFLRKYPLELDGEEIERIKFRENSRAENEYFDLKVRSASYLESIKEKAELEVKEALKFDFEFALGSFAFEYDLNPPIIGENFNLKDVIHLNLALEKGEDVQRVDYCLNKNENVALLTGANSGGKTTLLETISQIAIMAHMGLPVAGKEVEIKLLDELYHFSKKRSLDAGAFESFLNVFMPIVTTDSEKLILLDELEGITELDAAVKIISSFIDMIKESNSFGVIVTHMAKELMNYTD
ncbi:MAG: endonuclease MutS2, partial [Methanobrevibacter sp.]|nr:endonuclease MutS2 [Methanobrevibacter sp.]